VELFDLSNRVAIITGSTKGIGKAIAARMCQHGAKVVISSRKADACEAVTSEINRDFGASGGEAISIPADVGVEDELRNLVDRTLDKWGKITTLVPNAAVGGYYGPSAEMSDSAFENIWEINVKSVFKLCHMVLPGMVEMGSGSITIIASNSGLKGSAEFGGYTISKVAEHQIARNLAVEYGPNGIRVNAIAPGLIKTDFSKTLQTNPKRLERVKNLIPLRRIGNPHEIAGAAVFLASDAAAFLTGQVLNVDGGNAIV
jgi:NAD(P)-dependent dehydrogenase (short-subunit alcohol dehydrogenase family)